MNFSKFKGRNGITLIALVITIIVLLILAGVTIAMVVGDNGILSRSREAKDTTNIKKIQEEADLEAADLVAEYHSKDNGEVPATAGEYVAEHINGKTINGTRFSADSSTMEITATKDGITVRGTIQPNGSIIWDDENSEVAGGGTTTPEVSPSPSPSTSPEPSTPPAATITAANYGDTVNYTTTLNGQTLTDWKIFHQENGYVWLIYGDYLKNAAIPAGTYISKYGGYTVYASDNRVTLINYLTTKSNWSSLLTGTINGKEIDYTSSTEPKITAMGSPTLELYRDSWNAKYPNTDTYTTNQIYTATTSSAMSDGLNGYYVSRTVNPPTSETYVEMSGSQGYPADSTADTLYYPHSGPLTWNSTYGFWLASPSAFSTSYVMMVSYDGRVSWDSYGAPRFACRPVVCLPSSVLN